MRTSALRKVDNNDYLAELENLVIPHKKNGHSYVSLYCGGGGLDLGFTAAGFKPLFSSDIVEKYCETIAFNLPGHHAEAHDVRNLTGTYVKRKVGAQIDVVIGGPPCQSFSILGDRKSLRDPRGQLVYDFVRFISETKPQAFLFENVPGIMTVNQGKDWKNLIHYFESETGYRIYHAKHNAVMHGVPQMRQRIIIIGFRAKTTKFEWPKPTHAMPGVTLHAHLSQPRPSWMAFEDVAGLPNHIVRVHCDRVRKRYDKVKPGLRDKVDHTDRIHPDKPSGTVLVGSGAGGGRPFIHPYEPRHITVREAARLQSFPDWWEFQGGVTAAYRQVGNAVPPMFARAMARQLAKALD